MKFHLLKKLRFRCSLKPTKYTNNQHIKFHAYKNKLTNIANSNYKFKCSASWVLTKIKGKHLTLIKINFTAIKTQALTVSLRSSPCKSWRISKNRSKSRASYSTSLSSSLTLAGTRSRSWASMDANFSRFLLAIAYTEPHSVTNNPIQKRKLWKRKIRTWKPKKKKNIHKWAEITDWIKHNGQKSWSRPRKIEPIKWRV